MTVGTLMLLELADRCGASVPTMTAILSQLEREGIAECVGAAWRLTLHGFQAYGVPLLAVRPSLPSSPPGSLKTQEPRRSMLAPSLIPDREAV